MLVGPNGPISNFSLITIAEHQMGYIMRLVNFGVLMTQFDCPKKCIGKIQFGSEKCHGQNSVGEWLSKLVH